MADDAAGSGSLTGENFVNNQTIKQSNNSTIQSSTAEYHHIGAEISREEASRGSFNRINLWLLI
jgi:hypothetical protein